MYSPKDPETDKLTLKQARLLNELANPENDGKIIRACEKANIARKQYYEWVHNSPAFRAALEEVISKVANAHLPEVWQALAESCIDEHDPKAMKLYFELTGRYQKNVNVSGSAGVVIMSGEDNLAE